MRLSLARPRICLLCLFFSLCFALSTSAQSFSQESVSLEDALRQLTDRVAAIPSLRGPLRLEFTQDSSFAAETGKGWQQSFRTDLETHHLSVSEDPAAVLLRLGVAETPTQLVVSAGVHIGENEEVRLVTFPRANFRVAILPAAPVRLERQLVYQSTDRILDASSLRSDGTGALAVFVERNAELAVLRVDVSGAVQQSIALTVAGPLVSRDPQGELSLEADAGSVFLPGKTCQFNWAASPEAKCHAAKFTARAPTVLRPSCDTGGWKLLTDGSDWTTPDLLQAVPDNSVQKGSAAILSDFPGPVLSINGEQNPSSALVVTRNLRTGNYEVYKVSLVCGH